MDHHPVKVIRGFPPVATRRRTRLEGVLAVLGEIRACGPVWDVESGGTICVLVADCQRPQSRAGLKPETMTATFEDHKLDPPQARPEPLPALSFDVSQQAENP